MLIFSGLICGKYLDFLRSPCVLIFFSAVLIYKIAFMESAIVQTSAAAFMGAFFTGTLLALPVQSAGRDMAELLNHRTDILACQFYGIPEKVYTNNQYTLFRISCPIVRFSEKESYKLRQTLYLCSKTPLSEVHYHYFLPRTMKSVLTEPENILVKTFKCVIDKQASITDIHLYFRRWIYSRSSLMDEKYRHFFEKITSGHAKHPPGQLSILLKSLGLSHLLAISGLHFSVLLMFIRLIRIKSSALILLVPLGYLYLLDFRASAFRSFLMLACLMLIREKGREYYGYRVLFLSLILMTVFSPDRLLTYSSLFSFTAMFALLKCSQQGNLPAGNRLNALFRVSLTLFFFTSGLALLLTDTIFVSSILLNPLFIPLFSGLFIFSLSFLLLPEFAVQLLAPVINLVFASFTGFLNLFSRLESVNIQIHSSGFCNLLLAMNIFYLCIELYRLDELALPPHRGIMENTCV